MDFKDYAASETSEVVARLVAAASDKVTGDLQALRQAFDAVTAALDAALAGPTGADYREEVAALAERLSAESANQAEAAGAQVRTELQATIDQLHAAREAQAGENAQLAESLEELRARIASLESELGTQKAAAEAARGECTAAEEARKHAEAARAEVAASLDQARREHDDDVRAAREQLDSAHAEAARLSAQRDTEAAQSEKVAAALSTVSADLQEAKAQIKKLLAEAKATAAELEAARKTAGDHERKSKDLQARLAEAGTATAALQKRVDASDAEIARVRGEADAAAKASAQASHRVEETEARAGRLLSEQADTIRKHAATFVLASLDRLLAVYGEEGNDPALDEVLAAVADALSTQFSRVAVFRVQANRLEGVRQNGFDVKGDISQVLIPRSRDSLVTQAATSLKVETRAGRALQDTSGMPFGGTPEFGLALPLVVDGECLAVVYADDADQKDRQFAKADLREKFATLLQRQAAPLLARLAAQAKVTAELDQYAALLLNELERTHAEEMTAGVSDTERRKNLKENLEYARQMYAQRATAEGPHAAPLFERRLFAAVESGGDTPFHHDIIAIVGGRKRVARAANAARGAS